MTSGITAADWLQFSGSMLGAMIGAILAIGGAVWLESQKRNSEKNNETAILKDAMEKILDDLNTYIEMITEYAQGTDRLAEAELLLDRILRLQRSYQTFWDRSHISDIDAWQYFDGVTEILNRYTTTLKTEANLAEFLGSSAQVRQIHLEKLGLLVAELRAHNDGFKSQ